MDLGHPSSSGERVTFDFNYSAIRTQARRLNYTWWSKPYDLWLWGWRSGAPVGSDAWDDRIGVCYTDDSGAEHCLHWAATTDPGRAARAKDPAHIATLVPGHHRGIWRKGPHHYADPNTYQCLIPTASAQIPVYRGDDFKTVHWDSQGIQLHHGSNAWRVGLYSAGCQVTQAPDAVARILELLEMQAARGRGTTLSYALFV